MDNAYSPKAEDRAKLDDRGTIYIKKNYIDPAQGFLYSLGCSLTHFALFCASFTVEKPNFVKAKQFDLEYANTLSTLASAKE